MSSRLLRGSGIVTEAVAWRRVSSSEAIASGTGDLAVPSWISPPASITESPQADDTEQRVAAAHRQGFEEGRAAASQGLAGELDSMRMKLARSIEEITGLRLRVRREAEQDVVALALAVARRILHRELTVAPEALLGLVKAALDKIEAREVNQVRVAPADAPLLRQFFEQMGPPQRVEVIPDAALAAGSVLIESGQGVLDASVDTQLAEIQRGFADVVRSSP